VNKLKQRKINGGNDEFFTKPAIAELVVKKMLEKIKTSPKTSFVEPSAGDGKFIEALIKFNRKNIVAYDIDPKTKARKRNFLGLDFNKEKIQHNSIFIGNPPFGFASNLAVKFFNKSSKRAKYIVFILPRTFRKDSIKNKLNKKFHLIYEEDLPKNSFLVNGVEHNVPALFQIWERRSYKRKQEKIENIFIEYTTPENSDFVIRRVGGRCGTIFENVDFQQFSTQSNYFCRELQPEVKKTLKEVDFSKIVNNTAGVRSLSKNEITKILSERLNHT